MDNAGIDILAGGIALFLVWILLLVVTIGLFLWALIDAIKNPSLSDNERIIWIVVIVALPCVGSVLYLLIGRNKPPGGT